MTDQPQPSLASIPGRPVLPGWKRAIIPLGWDRIFLLAMIPVMLAAVVVAVLLTALIAALGSPLHLEGAPAAVLGVVLVGTFLGPLVGLPILMARRVRRAFPPELFPDPDAGRPAPRRSAAEIRADVARFDATLAPTAPPPPDAYDDRGGPSAG